MDNLHTIIEKSTAILPNKAYQWEIRVPVDVTKITAETPAYLCRTFATEDSIYKETKYLVSITQVFRDWDATFSDGYPSPEEWDFWRVSFINSLNK